MSEIRTPPPPAPNDRAPTSPATAIPRAASPAAPSGTARGGAAADSSPPRRRVGLMNNPVLTFLPWVIFWVVAGPRDWELATGCALLASVVLLLLSLDLAPVLSRAVERSLPRPGPATTPPIRLQAPKILDLGTTGFFLVLVIVGLFVDRQTLIGLETYSQAISSAALGLIVVASTAVGHPFTEQYARADTPPELWHTPLFQRLML